MTGLDESSALLLFDKAHHVWQVILFCHSDTVTTSTANAAHGSRREFCKDEKIKYTAGGEVAEREILILSEKNVRSTA